MFSSVILKSERVQSVWGKKVEILVPLAKDLAEKPRFDLHERPLNHNLRKLPTLKTHLIINMLDDVLLQSSDSILYTEIRVRT